MHQRMAIPSSSIRGGKGHASIGAGCSKGKRRGANPGTAQVIDLNGAPGGTRTHDHRLRRPVLYPAELQAHREEPRRLPGLRPVIIRESPKAKPYKKSTPARASNPPQLSSLEAQE
jgi:hypothetical protein